MQTTARRGKKIQEYEAAAAAEEEREERELFVSFAFRNENEEETHDSEASALTTTTLDSGWPAMSTTTDETLTPEMEDFLRDPIAAARRVGLIPMDDDEHREAQALSDASPDDDPDNGVGLIENWYT